MKLIEFVSRISTYLAMVTVTAMMLLTVTDVAMRYFLRRPITGTTEIIELMMICLLFGLVPAAIEKRHIKADFIIEHLPRKIQTLLDVLCILAGIALVVVMTWQGFMAGLFARSYNLSSSMLKIEAFPVYIIMVVSFATFCLAMVSLVVKGILEVFK